MSAPSHGSATETGVRRLFETPSVGGLPTSLVGCFPGDPEPLPAELLDEAGPLDLRLPGEVFVNAPPRPTHVVPLLEVAPVGTRDGSARAAAPAPPGGPRPALLSLLPRKRELLRKPRCLPRAP